MGKRAAEGDAKQQKRQITGFDLSLFDKQISHPASIPYKFTPLLFFLDGRLDHLDPCNRFGQPGIHLSEAPALLTGNRIELIDIATQGKDMGDHKKYWCH